MSYLLDIEKRLADVIRIETDFKALKPPLLTDVESVKEHNKTIKDFQADRLDAAMMQVLDIRVLLGALTEACSTPTRVDMDRLVQKHYMNHFSRLDPEIVQTLERRKHQEALEREKELKKNGKPADCEGQLGLFDPAAPQAEAASECVTYKVGEQPPGLAQ